ncbi:hypothetical protein N7491_010362 [Penicillium cf. griseofulvum]|uniref:Uncharacterized protein n=1 Tax=Penicillium cf. griseofulvum TaxID=2972120 RepID=A0A9W9N032_9EURO|nr:hypothetical protein N7472_000694 [Penicillium cf. griseofulvum]KAJ5421917.1 hypothetical protein N7491_010362 [Penicillium cf. griseofulvum]KAJ5428108.1 hypothetical protein N7445_009562 [Penicillium cf. griseofulvum]
MAMNLVPVTRLLESTDLLFVTAESSLSPSVFKKWASSFQLASNFRASDTSLLTQQHAARLALKLRKPTTLLGLTRTRLITHLVCILYRLPMLIGNVHRDVLHKNKSPPPLEVFQPDALLPLSPGYRIFRLKVDSFPPIARSE